MIYGSICSGIEAATVAWHPLGWRPAFFSEIDAFPRAVLSHRFPTVPLHGDFTTIQDGDYEPIDLLVGGTPCQGFSNAGKRGGLDDARGNLTLEYAHLARRLRPRWLVWENVPGVFSNNDGADFGAILACFAGGTVDQRFTTPKNGWQNAGIAPPLSSDGYGLAWRVLDAQFAGVPQRRRRVYLVGYLGDLRYPAAVLFERHSLQGHSPPSREAGQSVAGALAGVSPGGGWRVGAVGAAAGQIIPQAAQPQGSGLDMGSSDAEGYAAACAGTLNANGKATDSATSQDAESGLLIAHPLRAQAQPSHRADGDTYIPVLPFDTTQITAPTNRSNPKYGDPCHPLAASAHPPAIAFGGNNTSGPIECATALAAHGGPHGRLDFASETFIVTPILEAGARTGTSTTDPRAGIGIGEPGDPMFTLQAGKQHAVAFNHQAGGTQTTIGYDEAAGVSGCLSSNQTPAVCITGDITHTLKAEGFDASEDGTGRGQPLTPAVGGVRRLLPVECERLQGFPDRHTDIPYRNRGSADGPRYKAIGNSKPVPVVRWVGERIQMVDDLINGREAPE